MIPTCPTCGNWNPFHPDKPIDAPACTPVTCSAWTFTHRMTKEGKKPLRADGRADLRLVKT